MAIYNQYRPHTFSAVLGQSPAIALLRKQAQAHDFGHAYLIEGPSGSGKTTTARILAAAMNCETMNGTGEPCGQCQSCKAIEKGAHWDVVEIDGARYRGIDAVKDLCVKAHYWPLGKRKVYIIDECHALTPEAWNAMLKLLEEPPPHLAIILCTTEYEKIPATVYSRCQRIAFDKLPPDLIRAKLDMICQTQGIPADPHHLTWVAETACGNMRTAENTLEQVLTLAR